MTPAQHAETLEKMAAEVRAYRATNPETVDAITDGELASIDYAAAALRASSAPPEISNERAIHALSDLWTWAADADRGPFPPDGLGARVLSVLNGDAPPEPGWQRSSGPAEPPAAGPDVEQALRDRLVALTAERDRLKAKLAAWHSQLIAERSPEPPPEVCICAAVVLPEGRIFRGHRHHNAMQAAREQEPECRISQDQQGFITSAGRYVDRVEGLRLQIAAGVESAQPSGYRDRLFSEDLY